MDLRCRSVCGAIMPLWGLVAWTMTPAAVHAEGATRDLSNYAGAGAAFTVSITIDAPPKTALMSIEDSPPAGWTAIDNISNPGTYDPQNHKVKWLWFNPPFPSAVTYDLTPPGYVSSDDCFTGAVSFGGTPQPITGDACMPDPIPTVHEWGLIVMTLLVLAGGLIVFGHARTPNRKHDHPPIRG